MRAHTHAFARTHTPSVRGLNNSLPVNLLKPVRVPLKHPHLSFRQPCPGATAIQNEKFQTPQDIESPKENIPYI
jgi:hypothetical protein